MAQRPAAFRGSGMCADITPLPLVPRKFLPAPPHLELLELVPQAVLQRDAMRAAQRAAAALARPAAAPAAQPESKEGVVWVPRALVQAAVHQHAHNFAPLVALAYVSRVYTPW